jgi:hypothetical protein
VTTTAKPAPSARIASASPAPPARTASRTGWSRGWTAGARSAPPVRWGSPCRVADDCAPGGLCLDARLSCRVLRGRGGERGRRRGGTDDCGGPTATPAPQGRAAPWRPTAPADGVRGSHLPPGVVHRGAPRPGQTGPVCGGPRLRSLPAGRGVRGDDRLRAATSASACGAFDLLRRWCAAVTAKPTSNAVDPTATPATAGGACVLDRDCVEGTACVGGECEVTTCLDGALSAGETDVDCGGADCDPCQVGEGCTTGPDCLPGPATRGPGPAPDHRCSTSGGATPSTSAPRSARERRRPGDPAAQPRAPLLLHTGHGHPPGRPRFSCYGSRTAAPRCPPP